MPARKIDAQQGPTAIWLLEQIEEFLTINRMDNDGCYFGWLIAKDRTLVQRLRDGGDIALTRMDDVLAFMQNPVKGRRILPGPGLVVYAPLLPLNIKPRSIP